jgi:hypothetical protein
MARNQADTPDRRVARAIQEVSSRQSLRQNHEPKIMLVILLVLIRDTSRYFCFKNVEQLPNEITHRRRAGAHPRSYRALIVHY